MAHFILEYSCNLPTQELRLDALFAKLHEAAVASGIFPLAGIRSRAHRCEEFRVADGKPGNAFAHLMVRLGPGRSAAELKLAFESLRETLDHHFDPLFGTHRLALSLEFVELHAELRFNRNNLREQGAGTC